MLLGNCGSCIFQSGVEAVRAVHVSIPARSFHVPPRTACGYGCVARTQGLVWASAWYGPYWSSVHSMTLPSMSNRPQAFGFFLATSWYLPLALAAYHATSSSFAGTPDP